MPIQRFSPPAVARFVAAASTAAIMLVSGAWFSIYGPKTGLPAAGAPLQIWRTGSGYQVGIFDDTGRLSVSGAVISNGTTLTAGVTMAGADLRYVNTSGDTMTGALTLNLSSGFLGLKVLQMASGSILHAEKSLTSSGELVVNGAASLKSSLTVVGTVSGSLLKMSNISPRCPIGQISGSGQTLATGSGKNAFNVPTFMSGYVMKFAELGVGTAGTTNATSVQARLLRGGTLIGKMFSTIISVDSAEYNSKDAATPYAIDFTAATVQGGDVIQYDVPFVSTTAPKIVQLTQCFFAP